MRTLLKRWWFCLVTGGLAAIVLIIIAVATTGDSALATFRKVKPGMTRAEVDQLLDRHNDDLCVAHVIHYHYYSTPGRLWGSPSYVDVRFDTADFNRVVSVIIDSPPDKRRLWERIQDEYRYQKRGPRW
jgi:hypothetical protein